MSGLTEHEQPREVACVSIATNGGGTTKAKLALVLQVGEDGGFLLGAYNLRPIDKRDCSKNDANPDHVRVK